MQKLCAGLILVVVIALDWAGWRTFRADLAENSVTGLLQQAGGTENAVTALRTAIALRPDRAEPQQALSQLLAMDHPRQALRAATRAVALDPYDWENWHAMAMIQYQLGNTNQAWQAFQKGLHFNQGFQAHFEAANLALVLGRKDVFWQQLKLSTAAAASPFHNQLPYALAAAVRQSDGNGALVAAVVPQARRERTVDSVEYLISVGQVRAAEIAWQQVTSCPSYAASACGQAAADVSDALLASDLKAATGVPGNTTKALHIWNQAVEQGWLQQQLAAMGRNTDPGFSEAWLGKGFSWWNPGVVVHQVLGVVSSASSNQVLFRLDGTEPESARLLSQLVAVKPNSMYTIICQARRQGNGTQTGVQMVVTSGSKELLHKPVVLSSNWTETRAVFRTGLKSSLVDLQLVYQRPLGDTLMRTPVLVRRLEMQTAATGNAGGRP